MKKLILILTVIMTSNLMAQVGIGTDNPDPTAMLDLESNEKGFLPPRMTTDQRDAINGGNFTEGLTIYNTDDNCIQYWNATEWIGLCEEGGSGSNDPIATLDCAGAVNNGTLTSGTAASGVSSVISYTGGDGSAHTGQVVNSTGVTGLTATLAAGNFATGAGTLTYNITGTPSAEGVASFAISIGGQSCTLSRTVDAAVISIPATITLAQNRIYMVASIYDQDYLPFVMPSGAAAANRPVAADGSNEPVTIDVQGIINTTGIDVYIPVTATGGGTLPAYSTTINIPAALTEDGVSRDLVLSWASQPYTASTKSITANIKAVGGTLNAKKLDMQAGLGNDMLGVLLGTFNYPYNNSGSMTTYQVRDIAGIPDRMFGKYDNGGAGDGYRHNFLYLPVQAEDGNIWLNNNLGADYSNINHPSFNIAQQATSVADHHAYGSHFQWGRKPDGHELINWVDGANGTPVNGTIVAPNNNPAHDLIIWDGLVNPVWRVTEDGTLWASEASANNPCPQGFRLPTLTEWGTYISAEGVTNIETAANSSLRLSSPGGMSPGTPPTIVAIGELGRYYANSATGTDSHKLLILANSATLQTVLGTGYGQTVRCIKN